MLIDIIVSAQPDFMKIAPVTDAIHQVQSKEAPIRYRVIYTGQQKNLKPSWYEQFNIPKPQISLEAGPAGDAEQTATIMVRYEKAIAAEKPQIILLTGDSNAAMACALTAKKDHIVVCHAEAGLRNHDTDMADEINRLVTDAVSDIYFTPSHSANENLRQSGVADEQIFFVGNLIADALLKYRPYFQQPALWNKLKLQRENYFIISVRKPENITPEKLKNLLVSVVRSSQGLPIIFPVHPAMRHDMDTLGIRAHNLFITEYLDYFHYQYLLQYAKGVITDSGNIQDEATILQIPCITIDAVTERQETIDNGTNELTGPEPGDVTTALYKLFNNDWKKGNIPYMWDGKAGERIAAVFRNFYKVKEKP